MVLLRTFISKSVHAVQVGITLHLCNLLFGGFHVRLPFILDLTRVCLSSIIVFLFLPVKTLFILYLHVHNL